MRNILCDTEIAILLGVYNGEDYIIEQIDSIIHQTYKDWTLYIRDDGSTDNTLQVLKKYSNFDNIIVITDNLGNLGCNGNYFELLSHVHAKYYMFCNADDYWFSDKIEISLKKIKQLELIKPNTPIVVHSDLSIGDKNLNIIANSYWEVVNTDPERYKTLGLIGVSNVLAGATMLFNKFVINNVFPVHKDAPFFDHWFALKIVNNGHIESIHHPTMIYRQIGTNLAAVQIGKTNKLIYKLRNLKSVFSNNIREMQMLKSIGWGGTVKYLYYKALSICYSRLGYKYKSNY